MRRPPYTPIDNPSNGPPSKHTAGRFGDKINPNKARKPIDTVGGRPDRPVPVVGDNNQIKYRPNRPILQGSRPDLQGARPGLHGSRPGLPGSRPDLQGTKEPEASTSPNIDYQGWYTEGDTVPPVSASRQPPVSRISYQSREKEGSKTVTYANEWATVATESSTRLKFTPHTKPSINTNFEREWTVRDSVIRPTRPLVDASRTRPYQSRYTNEWGSYSVKSSPSGIGPSVLPQEEAGTPKDGSLQGAIDSRPPLRRPDYGSPPPRPSPTNGFLKPAEPTATIEKVDALDHRPYPFGSRRPHPSNYNQGPDKRRPIRKDEEDSQPSPNGNVEGTFIGEAIPTSPTDGGGTQPFGPPARPPFGGTPIGGPVRRPSFPPRPPVRPFRPEGTPPTRPFRPDGGTPLKPIKVEGSYVPDGGGGGGIPLRERPTRRPFGDNTRAPAIDPSGPGSSSLIADRLPPGIEPDTGTFINIDPSKKTQFTTRPGLLRPSRPGFVRPTTRPGDTSGIDDSSSSSSSGGVTKRPRPSLFTPKLKGDETTPQTTASLKDKKEEGKDGGKPQFSIAGFPFHRPSIDKKPGFSKDKSKVGSKEEEVKRKEVIGNRIDGAIVESIPGNALSAEDSDPQTRCQNTCGKNEICQISADSTIVCKCRPGYGKRPTSDSRDPCESEFKRRFNHFKWSSLTMTTYFNLLACREQVLQGGGDDSVREREDHGGQVQPEGRAEGRGRNLQEQHQREGQNA